MIKILLIEDEFIIAKDIDILLSKNNFASVDYASNYDTALDLFVKNSYHLIISDINLNNKKDGIEIVTEFSKIKKVPVVYLTAYSDLDIVKRAEKTMPFAYILKPYNNNQLKATINLALLNFNKQNVAISENEENTTKLKFLTIREKEVLISLSSGKITKEIAEELSISNHTVEQHKKNIKKKLNLTTVGELINFTMSTQLFQLFK
ncbi:DNA-binding response regulator [Lutibacter sp. HS1-25]|uniref:response regulator n=1 Tax=Lutibacter sp. HS1-25 TaxID=2485000 RepID=UPI001010ED2D|nr:response regulator [Lutibacter sp. HS1-25]RXP53229.1 DNA-binding response regulator [Lutibacter sp. HS1-25]